MATGIQSLNQELLCYNEFLLSPSASDGARRGVAQPGRAPGSGPGGRRFKSSLPDHLFSSRYTPSKSLKIPAVGKNATVLTFRVFPLKQLTDIQQRASVQDRQKTAGNEFFE